MAHSKLDTLTFCTPVLPHPHTHPPVHFATTLPVRKQTSNRIHVVQRKGPDESELLPPVALADKLLVVAWVAILFPASNIIYQAYMATL